MKTAQEITRILADDFRLTDAAIAQMVGSNQPTIWKVRNGHTKDCSASLYMALLQQLNELRVPRKKRPRAKVAA